jgi:hypothetical protein
MTTAEAVGFLSPAPALAPRRAKVRAGKERSSNRAVVASIVAGGLALSASLYPLPDLAQRLELHSPTLELPGHQFQDFPPLSGSPFLTPASADPQALVGILMNELPTMVLPNLPDPNVQDLPATLPTPDLPPLVQLVQALGLNFPSYPGGGGGGGGALPSVPTASPVQMQLLEFLMQVVAYAELTVPGFPADEIRNFLTSVLLNVVPPNPGRPELNARYLEVEPAAISEVGSAETSELESTGAVADEAAPTSCEQLAQTPCEQPAPTAHEETAPTSREQTARTSQGAQSGVSRVVSGVTSGGALSGVSKAVSGVTSGGALSGGSKVG